MKWLGVQANLGVQEPGRTSSPLTCQWDVCHGFRLKGESGNESPRSVNRQTVWIFTSPCAKLTLSLGGSWRSIREKRGG